MTKKIILYGIGDAESMYAVLRYWVIWEEDFSLRNIEHAARMLRVECPGIKSVYAMDDRRGLLRDYRDAVRANSIEGWAIFKDILEREGYPWIV